MSVARWDRYPDRVSARRAAAWALHPDRGGDPVAFTRALVSIDEHFGPSATELVSPRVRVKSLRRRSTGTLRLFVRGIRPRRRRYIQL